MQICVSHCIQRKQKLCFHTVLENKLIISRENDIIEKYDAKIIFVSFVSISEGSEGISFYLSI